MLPDAPKGTKGLSLFIIRIFLPASDGTLGERNGVRCGSIEHKMGIHANATAVLNFDNAKGFLIGEPHDGLNAMFTYMNVARIGTASQGVSAAERSYQGASAYARDRLAMRSISGIKNPDGPADAIVEHPDVRRMLLTQRVIAEGGRAMVTYASQFADIYRNGKTESAKKDAEDRQKCLDLHPKCQFPQSILTDMVQICFIVPKKLFRDFVRKSNSWNWFSLDRVQQSFEFFL